MTALQPGTRVEEAKASEAPVCPPRSHTEVPGVSERTSESQENAGRRKNEGSEAALVPCQAIKQVKHTILQDFFFIFLLMPDLRGGVGAGELTNEEFPSSDVTLRLRLASDIWRSVSYTHKGIENQGQQHDALASLGPAVWW